MHHALSPVVLKCIFLYHRTTWGHEGARGPDTPPRDAINRVPTSPTPQRSVGHTVSRGDLNTAFRSTYAPGLLKSRRLGFSCPLRGQSIFCGGACGRSPHAPPQKIMWGCKPPTFRI